MQYFEKTKLVPCEDYLSVSNNMTTEDILNFFNITTLSVMFKPSVKQKKIMFYFFELSTFKQCRPCIKIQFFLTTILSFKDR